MSCMLMHIHANVMHVNVIHANVMHAYVMHANVIHVLNFIHVRYPHALTDMLLTLPVP